MICLNQKRLNNKEAEPTAIHRLSKDEQETHYLIDAVDNTWIAESTIPKDIHRLEKQGWICTNIQRYADGAVMQKTFKAPRNCLSPRAYNPDKPKRAGRVLSEEQKQKMQKARKKKEKLNAGN